MTLRWQHLVPFAMLAVGYVLGRQLDGESARNGRMPRATQRSAGTRTRPAATAVERTTPVDPAPVAANRPEPTTPIEAVPDPPGELAARAIYLPAGWDGERFVHWYRSHARTRGFGSRKAELLRSFGAEVIEPLGRIPRRETLDALLDLYAELHAAVHAVDAALQAGEIAPHEVEARLAPARRHYSDQLYESLAYSDYRYLTREWADDKNPYRHFRHGRVPTSRRPAGGDPHAIQLRGEEDFVAWYRAYRHDLELPARDHEFLRPFYEEIVRPLGRLPRPQRMRVLQELYAAYRAEDERSEKAIRELFRGLRRSLEPIDYDRIRWWESWTDPLQELGLLEGH